MRKITVKTLIVSLCAVALLTAALVPDKVQARGEAGSDGDRSSVNYYSSKNILQQAMDYVSNNYNAAVDWVTSTSAYQFTADCAYDIGNGDSWTGVFGGTAYDLAIGYGTQGLEWGAIKVSELAPAIGASTTWIKSMGVAGTIVGGVNGAANLYDNIVTSPYASTPVMDTMTSALDFFSLFSGFAPNTEIQLAGAGAGLTSSALRHPYVANFLNNYYYQMANHPVIKWLPPGLAVRGHNFFTAELQAGYMNMMGYDGRDALRHYGYLDSNELTAQEYKDKFYWDRMNLYAQMVAEGREKEFEWLRDWLLNNKRKNSNAMPNNVAAKKPNIYLYPTEETEVSVCFAYPNLVTKSEPEYGNGWTVTAQPDGMLCTADGEKQGYLFYESNTLASFFQTDEGFIVMADERGETYRRVLESYGFNEQEILDFIEYWSVYLEAGADYVMYPVLTDVVDEAMPVSFSVEPDSIYRIWFGFARYDGGAITEPEIDPIIRNGFTVVEWGGAVLN